MADLTPVFKQLRAYKQSRLLAVALHQGVLLNFANGDLSVQEVAQSSGLDVVWLKPVLGVLVDHDLLSFDSDRYSLTDLGRAVNADNALNAFAGYHFHCYSAWASLPDSLEFGSGCSYHSTAERDPDFCDSYIKSLDEIAQHNLGYLLDYCQPHLKGHVLDVGCGPATLTRSLLAQNPQVKADALDLPPISIAAEKCYGQNSELNWMPGDLWTWQPDLAYNSLFCSHLIEYAGEQKILPLLQRLKGFVEPGGTMLFVLFVRTEQSDPDLDLFEISTGLNGEQMGHVPTVREFTDVLKEAQIELIECKQLPQGPSYREALFHCQLS